MEKILRVITKAALSDVTVLVSGESGSGKELVAQTVHARSLRREGPLVKVFCAALPDGLLETELFGYEQGAFTGAERKKLGKFDFAHQGTIFLDEIGEIPFSLQGKLLQVLQGGIFSRIGGNADVKVDVRVVATTNKVMRKAIEVGTFREDLFYRLNEVEIYLPPLRKRKEEIPFWVNFFIVKFNQRFNKHFSSISPDLMQRFMMYDWPGNLREIENFIQELVLLGNEKVLTERLKPKPGEETNSESPPKSLKFQGEKKRVPPRLESPWLNDLYPTLKEVGRRAARKAERELIWVMLNETHGNRKEAARRLEINYTTLCRKISLYSLGGRESRSSWV
jgi:two-component system response regulator AtoC